MATSSIYEQHSAAFRHVSAFVIAKDGKRVATVAFKYPKDGAGRLYAYVHWLGLEMVRGYAGGYGYDKGSAAVSSASSRLAKVFHDASQKDERGWAVDDAKTGGFCEFLECIERDDGNYWYDRLNKAGFTVWQAV